MRQQSGDVVVVTETNLVVRDGVVLVHHRDTTQLDQSLECAAGVQVLGPIDEVVGNQQHLRGHQRMTGELGVVHLHQTTLSRRRQSLQRAHVGRSFGETQRRDPGRDGARGHQDHLVSLRSQAGDLATDVGDDGTVDDPEVVGERRASDLGHDAHDEDGTGWADQLSGE